MEPLDIENQNEPGRCRFITLRKYSIAICLLEALAICLFIYFLVNSGRVDQNLIHLQYQQGKVAPSNESVNFRIYTNGAGTATSESVRLLAGLYPACDLRRYDLRHSVECHSSRWFECSIGNSSTGSSGLADATSTDGPSVIDVVKTTSIISTSKSGRRLHRERIGLKRVDCKPQLEAHLDPCRFATRLIVQPQQRQQKIIGWGGALTDSSAQNILSLTTNGTRKLLDDYFGANGLQFNMIRLTIGGSDFSSRFYTNDDWPKDDLTLENFQLREEDLLQKIPLLKFIRNRYGAEWGSAERFKVFASMWSPPTWMKTNEHFNKGQLKGSIGSQPVADPPEEELYFNALAELKIKFMLAYQRQVGFKFWGLTVMNEPLFAVQPFLNFNTMIFPPQDYANYVAKYLGPKLRQNSQLSGVKLIAHDDNRRYLANFTFPILANAATKKYIDGVATHSYADEAYDQLDLVYQKHHKTNESAFFVLPTELCSGHLPFMEKALVGDWNRGIHYGLDIIRSLQHSAAGWVDWNMVLDSEGGPGWLGGRLDAPIIVDKRTDMYHKSPMFYVLGQFSRYIPPGSVKVQTKVYNDLFDRAFEVVTFALTDSERYATVILNDNSHPIEVYIRIAGQKSLGQLTNTYHTFTCAPDSVSTIIYSSSSVSFN